MTLPLIVRRSLRQHALSTLVTAGSIALAGALLMAVWMVKHQAHQAFTGVTGGWDSVLGARGAKLQLVLNAIFHLEASPGNLPWSDFETISSNGAVAKAVPLAVGDNYHGYRLVGTTPDYFESAQDSLGRPLRFASGRAFDAGLREATVGSFAADRLGLKVGDSFHPYHGLIFDERQQHAETYVIVGILRPSNTPADRVIWIPLAGLQNMSGHDPSTASDISAVLVRLRTPVAGQTLDLLYNKQGNRLTFAWPIAQVMAQLFDKIGWFDRVLALVAGLVALVAAGSILASIYNSMSARRRDIAILRALGARRRIIFSAVVLEAAAIATIGMLAAYGLYFVLLGLVGRIIRSQTGIVLNPLAWDPVLVWAPVALISLGALAGLLPAWRAYRTDVAGNLAPES